MGMADLPFIELESAIAECFAKPGDEALWRMGGIVLAVFTPWSWTRNLTAAAGEAQVKVGMLKPPRRSFLIVAEAAVARRFSVVELIFQGVEEHRVTDDVLARWKMGDRVCQHHTGLWARVRNKS